MSIRNFITAFATCLLVIACGDSGPPLAAGNVHIVAPAPGRTASAAYFTLQNNSDVPAILTGVASKDFASAELHETQLEDGVASMRAISQVAIEPGAEIVFAPGGKHVMLMQPAQAFTPGTRVSLTLHFAEGNELLVEAPLVTRIPVE